MNVLGHGDPFIRRVEGPSCICGQCVCDFFLTGTNPMLKSPRILSKKQQGGLEKTLHAHGKSENPCTR